MSTTNTIQTVTLTAGEAFDDDAYECVTMGTDGRVEKANSATDHVIGIVASGDKYADGEAMPVMLIGTGGIGLVKCASGASNGGILIPTTTAGRASSVAALGNLVNDQMGFGILLEDPTSNDQICRFIAQTIAAPHQS